MINPKPQSKMFNSFTRAAETFTEKMYQNDYSPSRGRSCSPSPEPIIRSASISSPSTHRVLRASMVQRLENICETSPPPPPPVATNPIALNEKIMAPPMHYDLRTADATFVYNHIKSLTKNDVVATEFLEQIKHAMFTQTKPIVFGYIPAPPIEQIVKQVIGTKGYFFKMTTVTSGVYFIWHDTAANTFLFWGASTFKVVKAMNSIRWRIFKYCEVYNAQKPAEIVYDAKRDNAKRDEAKRDDDDDEDDDEDYDDMPDLISIDECQRISQGREPVYEHHVLY